MTERLEETLRRLKEERDEADRRYNDALTALDKRFSHLARCPRRRRRTTTSDHTAERGLEHPAGAAGGGGRRGASDRFHLAHRRSVPAAAADLQFAPRRSPQPKRDRAPRRAPHACTTRCRCSMPRLAAQTEFHTRLLLLLQQITPYVDTKDRDSAGGALVLNAALSALADRLAKHTESLAARESRSEARTSALAADAARTCAAMVGVAQQAALTAKRELERLHEGSDGSKPAVQQAGRQPDRSLTAP